MLDEPRLLRLISAYFDQELDSAEKGELETMLLGSAKAREIFLDQSEWHGLNREWALRNQDLMGDMPVLAPNGPVRFIPFRRFVLPALAVAACVALTLWIAFRPHTPTKTLSDRSSPVATSAPEIIPVENVALLSQSVDVEWEAGAKLYNEGNALPAGWLKIRKGTLRLDFYSGARVFLEGPASIDLISQDLARLEKGKLTAHVPPPAQGFTILSEDLRVIDRGTEFGMSVNGPDDREVHVFNGEVELQGAVPTARDHSLLEGDAISIRSGKWEAITASREAFANPSTIQLAAARESDSKWSTWRAASSAFSKTRGMLVHFTFEDLEPNSQFITNHAGGASPSSYGTIIGCEHVTGRWSKKAALGYAKSSDRVRFKITGQTPSLTMLAWVRVDSLPLDHNSLMSMSPGKVGEIHWKLDKAGRLLLGIRGDMKSTFESWERLVSPEVVTDRDFGRWMYLATVIDGDEGMMRHFVNGEEVASGKLKRSFLLQLGMANLGNFDSELPTEVTNTPVRGFTGRIDEFALISRALTGEEIRGMR